LLPSPWREARGEGASAKASVRPPLPKKGLHCMELPGSTASSSTHGARKGLSLRKRSARLPDYRAGTSTTELA